MRQVILDTETTGLAHDQGHRIIEIGCVEILSRRVARHFHRYLDPERDIDAGAREVHGLSRERLAGEPKFADIAAELAAFIDGAELIIHNASFDVGFLDAELARLPGPARTVAQTCRITDSLALARELHPGQRNSLDALCKRYNIDNSRRELHGALLDAQLLAEVYLAMTGGQGALALGVERGAGADRAVTVQRPEALPLVAVSPQEEAAHQAFLDVIGKASKGQCLWRQLEQKQ